MEKNDFEQEEKILGLGIFYLDFQKVCVSAARCGKCEVSTDRKRSMEAALTLLFSLHPTHQPTDRTVATTNNTEVETVAEV